MSKRSGSELASFLPLTTITPDGLAILDDGTLIRAVRLEAALTPLRMSAAELERTNRAVQEIPALLPDRQALQLITTARPFDWTAEVNRVQQTTADLNQALAADGLSTAPGRCRAWRSPAPRGSSRRRSASRRWTSNTS